MRGMQSTPAAAVRRSQPGAPVGVQGYRSHTEVLGATFHCCSLGEGVDRDIKSKESSIQFSPFSGAEWLCFTFSRALAAARGLGREETLPLSNTRLY